MTKREIAVLACRILALVAALYLLQASSSLLNLLSVVIGPIVNPSLPSPSPSLTTPSLLSIILALSPLALLLIFALFLWTQADFLSAKMVGEDDENRVTLPTDQNAQALAFSVVGAYLMTQALPQAARMMTKFLVVSNAAPLVHRDWTGLEAPDFTFVAAQLALGFWLIFGARGFIALLHHLRRVGRDAPQSQEQGSAGVSTRPEN